jgi:hypothetical protein
MMRVHFVGDSTLDNIYWMMGVKPWDMEAAKERSVEGQLHKLLPEATIHNVAYDGFTTTSLLRGDTVGRVLGHGSPMEKAYRARRIGSSSPKVWPLDQLEVNIGWQRLPRKVECSKLF